VRRLFQRDFQVVAQVGAAVDVGTTATAATTAASAENFVEDAAEGIGETAPATTTKAPAHAGLRVDAGVAVLVVGGAFLGVREDFVGFLGFLEFLLGRRIVRIAVRVVLHGQLAVGLLDLVVADASRLTPRIS
jgi:hypothetical protein